MVLSKLMHDEDNAIGLSVKNPAGETWTAYGDKRGLDEENNDNMVRCLKALQVSADEIYSAWKSKTAPSKSNYGAWTQAPTLESAKGLQILAPLFIDKNNRRSTITNRRNWSFTTNWSFFKTALDCVNSGWWKYPITIDGPKGVLNGSAVAATATSSWKCNVYFQDSQGGIREDVNSGGWKATDSSIFEAKKFSPLAVISFDSGDEVRPRVFVLPMMCCISNPLTNELDPSLLRLRRRVSPGVVLLVRPKRLALGLPHRFEISRCRKYEACRCLLG